MSVTKEPSGRRSVQVEIDVPGTPEQVWQAIASGEGVSSWFVPTELQEDGTVVSHMGPGMDAVAKMTEWDPPQRFAAESPGFGPDSPPIATEWIVEARSGGTCTVRVVHSLFASTDDWDNQLESFESGWPAFFRILRLYLTHFPGQHGSPIQLVATSAKSESEAWDVLVSGLGLADATPGQQRRTSGESPNLAGVAEPTEGRHAHQLLLRLVEPAPGIAHFFTLAMGGLVFVIGRIYLYGEAGRAAAKSDQPLWQEWMGRRFPPDASTEPPACGPIRQAEQPV